MSELSPEDRALVEAGGRGDTPESGARDRVRRRLAVQLGAGLGIATAATKTAAATSIATSLTTKIVLSAVLIGVVGAGGAALGVAVRERGKASASANANANAPAPVTTPTPTPTRTPPSTPPSDIAAVSTGASTVSLPPSNARVVEAPPPSPPRRSTAPAPETASAAPSPPPPSPPSTTAVVASPAPVTPTDALAEETRLLRDADAATRAGDAPRALALLAEHARRFPQGALGEERDAETVLALCAAGRTSEARAAAQRFLAARPGSALAGRVRASCGGS